MRSLEERRQLAARIRSSPTQFELLAHELGVEVKSHAVATFEKAVFFDDCFSDQPGPAGGGCNIFTRTVYRERGMKIHHKLHELMHVLCAVPFQHMGATPEHAVLMQVERAYSRACLNPRDRGLVVTWQEDTGVWWADKGHLGGIDRYQYSEFWRQGFQIARKVGLLDEQNYPTFAWPNWGNLCTAEYDYILNA